MKWWFSILRFLIGSAFAFLSIYGWIVWKFDPAASTFLMCPALCFLIWACDE